MGIIRKRIACVCGAAIASSASIKYQLEEFFEEQGIYDVEIFCCRMADLEDNINRISLIVTASKLFRQYPVPVVTDICYLTGIDCHPTNLEVLRLLGSLPEKDITNL